MREYLDELDASPTPVPPAERMLAQARERLADDLDAPGAIAVVDAWADAALDTLPQPDWSETAPALARDTADALLGIAL